MQEFCCEKFKISVEEGGFKELLDVKPSVLKEYGKWSADVFVESKGETRTLYLKKCPFCGNDTIQ